MGSPWSFASSAAARICSKIGVFFVIAACSSQPSLRAMIAPAPVVADPQHLGCRENTHRLQFAELASREPWRSERRAEVQFSALACQSVMALHNDLGEPLPA